MTAAIQDCIWCKKPVRKQNEEHILPDALGCPPTFVLNDCVCIACNNGLGHVDRALIHQFEIIAFMNGVPRKGGKPPMIDGWTGVRGRVGRSGPEIHINAGPQTVTSFGANLNAASRRSGIHDITMGPRVVGEQCELGFRQEFGREPKLRRALYKVGLGTLAFHLGAAEALRDCYDPVRAFVRKGEGEFDVLMLAEQAEQGHFFGYPAILPGCDVPVIELAVFGVWFAVDLDPDQKALSCMREALTRRDVANWMVLPRAA